MIYTYQGGTGRCLSPLSAVGKENMEEQKYEAYEDRFKGCTAELQISAQTDGQIAQMSFEGTNGQQIG